MKNDVRIHLHGADRGFCHSFFRVCVCVQAALYVGIYVCTVSGVPGLLCMISATRVRGHERSDAMMMRRVMPLCLITHTHTHTHTHTQPTPPLLPQVSNTYLEVPIVVNEFVTFAVGEDEMEPQLFNR